MISPYVRRIRLAGELHDLCQARGWGTQDLASLVGVKRQSISRLMNGHGATNVDLVMQILRQATVDEQQWNEIVTIARQAAERGWWERVAAAMGNRQALYANLEAGAATICEYQMAFLPGLLQTPAYTQARIDVERGRYPHPFDPIEALTARGKRQQMLARPGGPHYQVVIDELAVRRPAAPAEVTRAQLDHLVELGHTRDRITIRVLPLTKGLAGLAVPRCAFSTYHYPDPGDPVVVAVDTVTSDLILTTPADVPDYLTLYQQLTDAALTPADSLQLLADAAQQLTTG